MVLAHNKRVHTKNEMMGNTWHGPCKLRDVLFFVDGPLKPNKNKSKQLDHLASGESSQIIVIFFTVS